MNILIRSGDIRRRTLKSTKFGPNFACFWPLKFFGSRSDEILKQHYKIWLSTDQHAKFCAKQLTYLGDLALKKKNLKTSAVKLKSVPQAIASAQPNKKSELMLMRRARAYSSSCLQVILVYLHPFRRNSLFCSQKSPKKSLKPLVFRV